MSGATPQLGDELIRAVKSGDRALVSRLLEAGADVNHVDYQGFSALVIAAGNGQEEMVETLIRSGALVNQLLYRLPDDGRDTPITPLKEATLRKQTEVVRILLRNGADVNQIVSRRTSTTALHLAASCIDANGDSEIVSLMLENHADVNMLSGCDLEGSPLYGAASYANAPIVSKLIRAGADVNLAVNIFGNTETALMRASASPSYEVGKKSPRLYQRQIETISLLIRAGADINAVSSDGNSALLEAIMYADGGEDPARFLIAHGANVNMRTAMGTPLMKAIEKGDYNFVRLLILSGAETSDIPENLSQEFINPVMSSLQALVTHHSSLITLAFVELKNTEQTKNMFKNAAFRDSFKEWDSLRIDMVSRIVCFLVTLRTEDPLVNYILAPYLANADMERLDRFGLVLSFLTSPCRGKTAIFEISKCSSEPELIRFNRATFKYAILMGFFKQSFDSFVDQMHAVYSNLIADLGAIKERLGRIPDVNIGTVYQFRHGEFGIYFKFAENLKKILI